MKSNVYSSWVRLFIAALTLGWWVSAATANPYASGLTNNSGTISFVLNEAAENVKVVANGGATTHNLGALPKGMTTTNLGISGVYKVVVSQTGTGAYSQTSSDANLLNKFFLPRGVAVNRNPASPNFGRIYVANGQEGTTASPARPTDDGIYILNADQTDAVGQGNTGRTAGIAFTPAVTGSASPYRITIGPDNRLYIGDWSDASGNLYVTDPDVTTNQFVLQPLSGAGAAIVPVTSANNHGSIAAVAVSGSLTGGDLVVFTVDEDLQSDRDSAAATELNSLWKYTIGSGPLPYTAFDTSTSPVKLMTPQINFVSQTMDVVRGGVSNYLYISDRRSNGTEPGVYIADAEGNAITNSLQASRAFLGNDAANDILNDTVTIDLSPDGKLLATMKLNGTVIVVPLVNGVFDFANTNQFRASTSSNNRDIAFDAANNIYLVNSSAEYLRVFSPGGTTVATTGSDGTFTVGAPETTVKVVASDDTASEPGVDTGEFTITRTGDLTSPLTVSFTLAGTASNGVDYVVITNAALFPPAINSVKILVTPLNDSIAELTETVVLTLQGAPNYSAVAPSSATVNLIDDEPPELSISTAVPTMYERVTEDNVVFRITRRGQTNVEVTANLAYGGGTATPAVDFTGPPTVTIPAGVVDQDFTVSPLDDNVLEGDETVVANVATGSGYAVGSPGSASATILDDELPPETGRILFSDNFETDTSAQWQVRFAANNDIQDFFPDPTSIVYDYSQDSIPPAPNSGGTTKGLRITVNKNEGSSFGAAGVNFYPIGRSFSNDYALRFNMYLIESTASTTEFATFGINHSGTRTNWFRNSSGNVTTAPVDIDGLWYAIVADASLLGDYTLYTGTGPASGPSALTNRFATAFQQVFKAPPFSPGDSASGSMGGSPANLPTTTTPQWVDVEVNQISNIVTLMINRTVILQRTNSTPFGSGDIMLGYTDPYDSVGNTGAVFYDNVRVVNLGAVLVRPSITAIQIVAGNVQIDFTGAASDAASAFALQGSGNVATGYANESGAGLTQLSPGSFRATVAPSGPIRFYRISR
jgi:hypothetical protein